MPNMALTTEPEIVPIFPALNSSASNAKLAIKSDIVKPIPARHPAPTIDFHVTPVGKLAALAVTASQLNSTIPSGFPTISPRATAQATGCPTAGSSISTPALAKANSGMITNATQGWSAASRRSSGETVSIAATFNLITEAKRP